MGVTIVLSLLIGVLVGGFSGLLIGAFIGEGIHKDKLENKQLKFFAFEYKRLTKEQAAGAMALWRELTKQEDK